MKYITIITAFYLLLMISGCTTTDHKNQSEPHDFISIGKTSFDWKGNSISLNDYEISDHTVTNLGYKKFIGATDFSLSSARIQMSIAYLDGKTPAVITQTGMKMKLLVHMIIS
jgi:hypothetical protein